MSKQWSKIDRLKERVEGVDMCLGRVEMGMTSGSEELEECGVFVDYLTPTFLTDQDTELFEFLKIFGRGLSLGEPCARGCRCRLGHRSGS
jgi:hypothetical protein